MFAITEDEATAVAWREAHADAVGLPDDAYVREIKEHPHQDVWAYRIDESEETADWAIQAQADAKATDDVLGDEWYLGASAPAESVFDDERYYTTDPGVTSLNGLTGDLRLEDLVGDVLSIEMGGTVWKVDYAGISSLQAWTDLPNPLVAVSATSKSQIEEGDRLIIDPSDESFGDLFYFTGGDPYNTDNYVEINAGGSGGGGGASFTTDLEVTETVGALSPPTTFPAGTSLEKALIAMFFSYAGPSLSLGYSGPNTVEAGVLQDQTINLSYASADGGDVDSLSISREGSGLSLENAPSLPVSGNFAFSESVSEQLSSPGSVQFTANTHFLEGPLQNNVPDPPGPGNRSAGVTLRWKYRFWAASGQIDNGFDVSSGSPDSNAVRALPTGGSGGREGLGVGSSVYLSNVSGKSSLELAVPAGKTLSKVDVQVGTVGGTIDTADFESMTVGVLLPDGTTTKNYTVYQYVPASAFDPANQVQVWFRL